MRMHSNDMHAASPPMIEQTSKEGILPVTSEADPALKKRLGAASTKPPRTEQQEQAAGSKQKATSRQWRAANGKRQATSANGKRHQVK